MSEAETPGQSHALQKILHPVTVDDFFNDFHEKEFFHVSRNYSEYYNEILSVDELDEYLCRSDLPADIFKIAAKGKTLPLQAYSVESRNSQTPLADTGKCFSLFEDGASFVLQKCHMTFPNIKSLCKDLAAYFRFFVQANIYITPPSAQGFNVHPDFYDVFILQVSGSKVWKIHDYPVKLPQMSNIGKDFTPGPLIKEIELQAGDMLYLPRGVLHAAKTTDSYSTHITIGLSGMLRWVDFFKMAMEDLGEIKSFREGVPTWSEGHFRSRVESKVDELRQFISQKSDWGKYYDQFLNRYKHYAKESSHSIRRGYFKVLTESKNHDSSVLFKNMHTSNSSVVNTDGYIELNIDDKTLKLPSLLDEPLQFVLANDSFYASDLPGSIDNDTKLFLCQQLMKNGLLTT
ncbi:MAG: cupin domain-containing protein [Cyclobacteriaceae bacterium]